VRLDRGNLVLLVLALLLAGGLVLDLLLDRRTGTVEQVVWPAVDAEQVDAFRLTNPHGAVAADLQGDRWVLQDPPGEALDPALLAGVLRTFSAPTVPDVKLADRVDDPATYGFTDDERVVVEFLGGGQPLLALELGRGMPRGDSFVRPLGDDAVYRAHIPARFRLEKAPGQWRDRTILAMEEGRVIAMDLQRGEELWQYRRSASDWVCLEEPELLLDVALVEQMARTLSRFRAHEIVDDPPPGAFSEVPMRVTAGAEGGVLEVVEFGAEADDGALRYLRHGARVYLVAAARYETFDVLPPDLRDRSVVRLDYREVQAVRLRAGTFRFAARPVDEYVWELTEPASLVLDQDTLSFSVDALLRLRAFELVDDVERAASGVDDEGAVVFTIERVESSPVVIRVGPERDGRHLVLREGRSQLYAIPPQSYRSLVQGFGIVP